MKPRTWIILSAASILAGLIVALQGCSPTCPDVNPTPRYFDPADECGRSAPVDSTGPSEPKDPWAGPMHGDPTGSQDPYQLHHTPE